MASPTDPREPEAAAADAVLQAEGKHVPPAQSTAPAAAARHGAACGSEPPVMAAVAEKPHPGSGSSRIGARPGATHLATPETEAELVAAGLPGA
ncbi:hypothetical protein D9Q98_010277 [Chlorella vulgaris]|uniref:Uncharacterized protein n=1 Tax=Chlorella vulgaris TaxID=3077 RepID=A0A9D4TJW5_CHLVU|nr:hypothetical protein D9Q98_010277 [Chlorella vulgaris]